MCEKTVHVYMHSLFMHVLSGHAFRQVLAPNGSLGQSHQNGQSY